MSQQSKLATWQQLKAQNSQPINAEESTINEIIVTPSVDKQEILVDLPIESNGEIDKSSDQVTNTPKENSELEVPVKKSNKKGTTNV